MNNVFQKFLILSLILHLLLLFFLKMPRPEAELFPKPPKLLWIDLKKQAYEIVDVLPPAEESRPKDSKFVGMYDMSAQEETVAAQQKRGQADRGGNQNSRQKGDGLEMTGRTPTQDFGLSEDFYPDFKWGPHTYLNVLRYPDTEYIVRLKRVFKRTFNPWRLLAELSMNQVRDWKKIEVVVGLSIDATGNLIELFVISSSGLPAYDDEALRTIRANSPFSKPPPHFLDKNKIMRIAWTFGVHQYVL